VAAYIAMIGHMPLSGLIVEGFAPLWQERLDSH
jgi:hypothetical protein